MRYASVHKKTNKKKQKKICSSSCMRKSCRACALCFSTTARASVSLLSLGKKICLWVKICLLQYNRPRIRVAVIFGHPFSKVLFIACLYSKCTWALTFQNAHPRHGFLFFFSKGLCIVSLHSKRTMALSFQNVSCRHRFSKVLCRVSLCRKWK